MSLKKQRLKHIADTAAPEAIAAYDIAASPAPASVPATTAPVLPEGSHTALAARATYIDAICHAVPELAAILKSPVPESDRKPLAERHTDELIELIDSGMYLAQIARKWGVDGASVTRWIAADAQRSARAREARKRQAALWDWVAFQVIAHAPSDKTEVQRAEKLAQHCRWRAEAFNRDEYGQNIKVTQAVERPARELTTRELEIIARGGVLTIEGDVP